MHYKTVLSGFRINLISMHNAKIDVEAKVYVSRARKSPGALGF